MDEGMRLYRGFDSNGFGIVVGNTEDMDLFKAAAAIEHVIDEPIRAHARTLKPCEWFCERHVICQAEDEGAFPVIYQRLGYAK